MGMTYYAAVLETLVKGSLELNRMKNEIKILEGIVSQLVESHPEMQGDRNGITYRYPESKNEWRIIRSHNMKVLLRYSEDPSSGNSSNWHTASSHEGIPVASVRVVHAGLPYLIRSLMEDVAVSFEEDMKPYIDAGLAATPS